MLESRGRFALVALLAGVACVPRPEPITLEPSIAISTEKVSFRHSVGIGHGAPEQIVTIRNQGGGVLMAPAITVRYLGEAGDWLHWEVGGDVNAYQLKLRVQNPLAGPLPVGSYTATVEADCASGGAAVIEIDEQVSPKAIAASPNPLQVTAALGGKGWLQRMHVEEALHGDLPEPTYAIALPAGESWLQQGTPFLSWSDEEQTDYWDPDLRLVATGLPRGQYDATVTATSADVGSVSVPVHLVVDDWADVPDELSLGCPLPLDLPGGRVLCAAETPRIWDQATGGWTRLPPSPSALPVRSATLLPTGAVLFLSQSYACSPGCVEQVEWAVLDPDAGAWARHGTLANAQGATATPLADGRVLLTGHVLAYPGEWNPSRASAVLDPVTGTVTDSTTNMIAAHQHAAAVRLSDGRILVAGGVSSTGFEARVDVFTPPASGSVEPGRWAATGSMSTARADLTLVRLGNGRVLAAGGYNASGLLYSAEIYDPSVGRWSLVGSMDNARSGAGNAVTLPDGSILVTGGADASGNPIAKSERYDPATGKWSPWAELSHPRSMHRAMLLDGTWVLVFGGDSQVLGSARRLSIP